MRKPKRKNRGPEDGFGPGRVVIELSPHRMTGAMELPGVTLYPSQFETVGEERLHGVLLLCSDVTEIAAQAEKEAYELDGVRRYYTSDARLRLATSADSLRVHVEEKNLAYLVKPDNLKKYLAIAKALRSRGDQLNFITHDQLKPVWCENAHLLFRYLHDPVPADFEQRVIEALPEAREIAALLADLNAGDKLAKLYGLVAQKKLCIDWDVPLNRRASVSLPNQPFARMTYERLRTSGRFADLLAEMALGRRPPDQRLRAAARARRWPLSGPSPLGFVGALTPAQLGHFKRAMSTAAANDVSGEVAKDGDATGDESATEGGD